MRRIRTLSAFTLAEMVVVLILTTIVVGLAFTVLNLVQKQMLEAQKNYSLHSEMNLLKQSLWIDFNRYPEATYNPSTQKLKLESEMDSVSYYFHDNYIIKDLDTFNINIETKAFFYKGNPISSGAIDAIKIFVQKEKKPNLFIYKQNDATTYIN